MKEDLSKTALGRYLSDLSKQKRLSHQETLELSRELRSTQKELFTAVYKLNPEIIRSYVLDSVSSEAMPEEIADYSAFEIKLEATSPENRPELVFAYGLQKKHLDNIYEFYQSFLEQEAEERQFDWDYQLPETEKREEIDCIKSRLDRYVDKFSRANLGLVVSMARKAQNRGVDLEDLIQAGNLGLIKGALRFDPEAGFKFSTYANWWIKHNIQRSIQNHGKTIRVPVHVAEPLKRITSAVEKIKQLKGPDYQPSAEELSERTDISYEKIKKTLEYMENNDLVVLSLDVSLEDGKRTFQDLVSEKDTTDSEDEAITQDLFQYVIKEIENLPEKERTVLVKRFGLDGKEYTLREVGEEMGGLSRERIRQLEEQALRKVRDRLKIKERNLKA